MRTINSKVEGHGLLIVCSFWNRCATKKAIIGDTVFISNSGPMIWKKIREWQYKWTRGCVPGCVGEYCHISTPPVMAGPAITRGPAIGLKVNSGSSAPPSKSVCWYQTGKSVLAVFCWIAAINAELCFHTTET